MRGLFVIFLFSTFWGTAQDLSVYELLENGTFETLDAKINAIKSVSDQPTLDEAYLGALYCKRAAFQKSPKDKLSDFKQGAELLENCVNEQPKNVEFRFLRYIIQTKSPRFLGYTDNINEDKDYIEHHKDLISKQLKQVIKAFSSANLSLSIDV